MPRDLRADCGFVEIFILESEDRVDRKSAHLRQSHACQRQTVVDLYEIDLSRIELYVDAQQIAARRHSFPDHQTDIMLQCVEQIDKAARQLLLGLQRHHHPISRVNGIDHVLCLAVVDLLGQMLGIAGDLVHRHYLAAHKDRLRQRDSSEKDIVDIVGHRIFWQIRDVLRYILSVGTLNGHPGLGVGHQRELV